MEYSLAFDFADHLPDSWDYRHMTLRVQLKSSFTGFLPVLGMDGIRLFPLGL